MSATVLITGFGPFPGVPDNATARLVPLLAGALKERWPHIEVIAEVLPTEWQTAPARVAAMLALHRPRLALHFGVAKEAMGFEIEMIGRNRCRMAADAAGYVPDVEKLLEEGADAHATNLPVESIVAHLRGLGLPARASQDAGGYLCNALLYHSMRHIDAQACGTKTGGTQTGETAGSGILAGFVHVPACLSGSGFSGAEPPPECPLTWDQAVDGSLEIIRVALAPGIA